TVPILDAARRAGVRIADGQAGRYEVKAFCPFCLGRTKNPHLYLNTEKNRFFCQRCGEHGNSVSLYAKIRGISNKEAFEELEKSNLQMFPQAAPKEPRQEYMAPLEQRHDVYYDLLALLSLSEHDFLDLLGRGLTLDAIEQNMYRSMPVPDSTAVKTVIGACPETADCLSRIVLPKGISKGCSAVRRLVENAVMYGCPVTRTNTGKTAVRSIHVEQERTGGSISRAMSTAQPLPSQRGRSRAIPRAVCPMERFTYAHLGSMQSSTFPRPSVHFLWSAF
ncbi:hypothetical protein GUB24_25415, partial [Escherichia coli]|nr:hypothetical protein [Escherichia coli]